MPSSLPLPEHLTNFCLLKHYESITCRVLRPAFIDSEPLQDVDPKKRNSKFASARTSLRTVENEARRSRLLCFLPPSSLHLWVFFGERDSAASLIDEFAHKHNLTYVDSLGLTFSARELLENQNGVRYESFICSVLARLNHEISNTTHMLMLNPRTLVCYAKDRFPPENLTTDSYPRDIIFVASIDLQLLNDDVVLSAKQLPHANWNTISRLIETGINEQSLTQSDALIAPCGKLARYKGISPGLDSSQAQSEISQKDAFKQMMWKESVRNWLEQRGIRPPREDIWVDLDVVVPEVSMMPQHDQESERDLQILRSILWPSSLVFSKSLRSKSGLVWNDCDSKKQFDPFGMAEQWFRNSDARAQKASKIKASKIAEKMQGERVLAEAASREEVFTSPAITRPHPDIQSAAAIYPTPPDGPLSHVTPGVSSIDGAGVTPHEALDAPTVGPAEGHDGDVEMMDTNTARETGFFDDDLFEDNVGENSESGDIDNDPDWGFFDEPDADPSAGGKDVDLDEMEFANAEPTAESLMKPPEPPKAANVQTGKKSQDELSKGDVEDGGDTEMQDIPSTDNYTDMKPPPIAKEAQPAPVEEKPITTDAPAPNSETNALNRRRSSQFEAPSPARNRPDDDKYTSQGGRFWFGQDSKSIDSHRRLNNSLNLSIGQPHAMSSLDGNPRHEQSDGDESSDGSATPTSLESTPFDSSELFSEDDTPHDPWSSLKRKWADIAPSPSVSAAIMDESERRELEDYNFSLLDSLFEDFGQWSMETILQAEGPTEPPSVPDNVMDQMQIAQLLFDLVLQSFLLSDIQRTSSPRGNERKALDELASVLNQTFGLSIRPSFLELNHSSGMIENREDTYSDCETPKVRVRRGDKDLEALPPLLAFWETFGLQPVGGKRDIMAFCIYPANDSLHDSCETFLSQLAQVYRTCNLGDHRPGPSGKLSKNGLIAWPYDPDKQKVDLSNLCKDLGVEVADVSTSSTIVIYVLHHSPQPEALVEISSSLLAFFKSYAKSSQDKQKKLAEIVPQVIPLSFIATEDSFVIPPQADYIRLALELYNRCPSKQTTDSGPAAFSPAILLAENAPKLVSFNLSTSAVMPLKRGGHSLHLAYSLTLDQRWITAAWTDNCGKKFLTMPYCLRSRSGDPGQGRPISDIIKEMWETSLDIIASSQGSWRLIVCREGPMMDVEINSWTVCHGQQALPDSMAPKISLIILTIDTEPAFQLMTPVTHPTAPLRRVAAPHVQAPAQNTPTSAAFAISNSAGVQPSYGTPVSTPTPSASQSVMSPEQTLSAGTPGAANAGTPSGVVSNLSQQTPQNHQPPSQSPAPTGARANMSMQSQNQPATPVPQQPQAEVQALLEADPSAFLESPGSQYTGILSPFPAKRSSALLENQYVLATGYLLRARSDGEVLEMGFGNGASDPGPETVLGVNLIWVSIPDEPQSASQRSTKSQKREVDDFDLIPDPIRSATTSPAKSSVGPPTQSAGRPDTTTPLQDRKTLLHDILPLLRNLITLSETRGMGHVSPPLERERTLHQDGVIAGTTTSKGRAKGREALLPWHIMTSIKGRQMLERCGL